MVRHHILIGVIESDPFSFRLISHALYVARVGFHLLLFHSFRNVCIWDMALQSGQFNEPDSAGAVDRTATPEFSFKCFEHGGADSLCHIPSTNMLVAGGHKGYMVVFDIAARLQLHTVDAHSGHLVCLTHEPRTNQLVSGGSEGDLKVRGASASV